MMRRKTLAAVAAGLVVTSQVVSTARAQSIKMRENSVWTGSDAPAPAGFQPETQPQAPGWAPSPAQLYSQRRLQGPQGWLNDMQQAQSQADARGFNPQRAVQDLRSRLQYAQQAGDLETVADASETLAREVLYQGFRPYAPDVDPWQCYATAANARATLLRTARLKGDQAAILNQASKLNSTLSELLRKNPDDARWVYLQGMSYYDISSDNNKYAKAALLKCLQMPGCTPEMKSTAQATIADINRQEEEERKKEDELAGWIRSGKIQFRTPDLGSWGGKKIYSIDPTGNVQFWDGSRGHF